MPTYEFRCPQGHDFEKFYRTISGAEAQAACPVCGEPAERVMSATGFAFKGSGFYLTDYGKNAHRDKGTPAPAGGDAAGNGAGDGAKGDAKPDATPAPAASTAAPTGDTKPKSASKSAESKAPAPATKKSTE
ncbi:MAG TPA: zinc ribbon domain-containing protein [Gemmatimonadaceae bacterium]|nr:zinc ribbon domain-containing protein [Gemmatimonadaceae bacterium]